MLLVSCISGVNDWRGPDHALITPNRGLKSLQPLPLFQVLPEVTVPVASVEGVVRLLLPTLTLFCVTFLKHWTTVQPLTAFFCPAYVNDALRRVVTLAVQQL